MTSTEIDFEDALKTYWDVVKRGGHRIKYAGVDGRSTFNFGGHQWYVDDCSKVIEPSFEMEVK